jgi:predicted NBD/HSP70 family sugar kinase
VLRRVNAAVVLRALMDGEAATVVHLAALTGLSRPTVTAVMEDLVGLGLASEPAGSGAAVPGRRGRRFEFRADGGLVLGVDVGEFKVRAAIADLRGDVVAERRRGFEDTSPGGTHRLVTVRRCVAAAIRAAGAARGDILGTAVGCTGAVDPDRGTVLFSGAFPAGFDIGGMLAREVSGPVVIDNDANFGVLGEQWRGAARDVKDLIYILAGERLGAGILVDGHLVRGHEGAAGEMAFLGARARDTGAQGIAYLVRTLGAEAVARISVHGQPAGRTGSPGRILSELVGGDPRGVHAESVFTAARRGDPLALELVEVSLQTLGASIVTMALVLNPELVIVGGGVARAGELLIDPLRRRVERMTRLPPRIQAGTLAERAVVVGAIRVALEHVIARLLDQLAAGRTG